MRYNGVIQRKLSLLNKQLLKLEEYLKGIDYSEFSGSWAHRALSERALQVSVEIVIDVAERIISLEGKGPVSTASEAIECLVSMKILKSAKPYVDMVRFRNVIVHQYEEVDPSIVYALATTKLSDFRKFIDEISDLE
jgi:uncharacterized protein YutE (UPF0331/DUF86 family)